MRGTLAVTGELEADELLNTDPLEHVAIGRTGERFSSQRQQVHVIER